MGIAEMQCPVCGLSKSDSNYHIVDFASHIEGRHGAFYAYARSVLVARYPPIHVLRVPYPTIADVIRKINDFAKFQEQLECAYAEWLIEQANPQKQEPITSASSAYVLNSSNTYIPQTVPRNTP